jgi:hypothetical protein
VVSTFDDYVAWRTGTAARLPSHGWASPSLVTDV